MTESILFICTGNYYRSRFSEMLFNHLAPAYGVTARAISRGLMTELISPEMGGLSPHALRGLKARGIALDDVVRQPMQVQEPELMDASVVIAIDEWEHRPMIQQRFPHWVDRIQYWQVADIQDLEPEVSLFAMETRVRALLEQLKHE
jgi:protein-tyrosine phosphatase